MQGIPDRVLSLIEASGLSRRAFAHEIGLDDSKLSKSLSGTRRFSSLDLARIADRWNVTVDWLVTGEDQPLAIAARTTSGDARTALEAAKRYSTMRDDLASLGWPQPWRPVPTGCREWHLRRAGTRAGAVGAGPGDSGRAGQLMTRTFLV